VKKYILCGDYSRGVARIQYANSDCGYKRGKFVQIPLGDILGMSEYFRRVVIRLFLMLIWPPASSTGSIPALH
jgi:hypothetical protein